MEGEFTNLIGKWLKAEKLTALNPAPSSLPPGPSAEDAMGTKSALARASEQKPAANADKETVASNPLFAVKEPIGEVTLRVTGSKALIYLKEEPAAIAHTNLTA